MGGVGGQYGTIKADVGETCYQRTVYKMYRLADS